MPLDLKLRTVYDLPLEAKAKIVFFNDDLTASKLMTMGVLQNKEITMVGKAPFGGACYIKVDNQRLALRKSEAEMIIIETFA
ncbi:MAG: ferrous iron transport protein A [Saprospiraceae bacterium]|jgi:ferrous iron transport protein A|nr:ferrous iron transport protein A [Saprospiraceae bacterium]MBL0191235.1 ferrous iron transport protein A [Saprospiraceae bacterium]MBL0293703.1 ferrous iron transport protein A [Saprospiraceae bacterium]